MSRRLISFALLIVIITFSFPVSSLANEKNFLSISVIVNGEQQIFKAIDEQNDYFVDLNTLARFTGFSINNQNNSSVDLIRGAKKVTVFFNNPKLKVCDSSQLMPISKIIVADGVKYFPFSEVIPWLNTTVGISEDKTLLKIDADVYSMYDFINYADLSTLKFDFNNECRSMGQEPLFVKLKYLNLNFINKEKLYKDILTDYIYDNSASIDLLEKVDAFYSLRDSFKNLGSKNESTDLAFSTITKILSTSNNIYEYIQFMSNNPEQLKGKLNTLENLKGSENKDLEYAINQTQINFMEIDKGVEDVVLDGAFDILIPIYIDRLSPFPVVQAISLYNTITALVRKDYENDIGNMSLFDEISKTIQESCMQYDIKVGYGAFELSNFRNDMLLYLYIAKRQYEAVRGLSQNLNLPNKTNEYDEILTNINVLITLANLTQKSETNDSLFYYKNGEKIGEYKSEYTNEIKKLIKETSECQVKYSANDFLGLSVNEMISILGDDFEVAEFIMYGASALVQYKTLPYCFMPVMHSSLEEGLKGDEIITDIEVFGENGIIIDDLSTIHITFSEFEKKFSDNKWIYNTDNKNIWAQAAIKNRVITYIWSGEDFENFALQENYDVHDFNSDEQFKKIIAKYFEAKPDEKAIYVRLSINESGLVKSFWGYL